MKCNNVSHKPIASLKFRPHSRISSDRKFLKNSIASQRLAVRRHVLQTSSRDAVCRRYPVQSVQNSACHRSTANSSTVERFTAAFQPSCSSFVDLHVSLWKQKREGISISRRYATADRAYSKTNQPTDRESSKTVKGR